MYDEAARAGHLVDEHAVLREIALCVGRVVMCVLLLFLLPFGGFSLVFVTAALVTFCMNALVKKNSPFAQTT